MRRRNKRKGHNCKERCERKNARESFLRVKWHICRVWYSIILFRSVLVMRLYSSADMRECVTTCVFVCGRITLSVIVMIISAISVYSDYTEYIFSTDCEDALEEEQSDAFFFFCSISACALNNAISFNLDVFMCVSTQHLSISS